MRGQNKFPYAIAQVTKILRSTRKKIIKDSMFKNKNHKMNKKDS